MNIIYAITYIISYWVGIKIFSGGWKKDEMLPVFPRSNTGVIIGKFERGYVYHNFKRFAHMVVAGTTGYGKTNFLKCLISQLNGEISLIDLKGGFDYDRVTATDITEARKELERVVSQMKVRRKNHIYVIIDEAGELLKPDYMTRKEAWEYYKCQSCVSEIARLGRGFHVHLIYATQYPTRNILNGQIKQNAETRVCFRLPTQVASLVALDEAGAEELPTGKFGMGIYKKDMKLVMKGYQFMERDGWDEKVRNKTNEGNGNTFEIR